MLGALDIDRDEYVGITKAMLGGDPPCGRFGSKGAVYFVRVQRGIKSKEFRVNGDTEKRWDKVVEALFFERFCVIPPTIHKDTGEPYRWIGTPLLDIDLSTLPLIGA